MNSKRSIRNIFLLGSLGLCFLFLNCTSTKTTHNHLYPEIGRYELKVYAALHTIDENFKPGRTGDLTNIIMTQGTYVCEQEHHKGNRNLFGSYDSAYPPTDDSYYCYTVTVTGSAIDDKLSVAGHAYHGSYYGGPGGKMKSPAHGQVQLGMVSLNKLKNPASGSIYALQVPGVISSALTDFQDHSAWTEYSGAVPQNLATLTGGVFYTHTIGFTNPPAPINLAYYPQGSFQGNIPSYVVDQNGATNTRIYDINRHLYSDINAHLKLIGNYDTGFDKVTGTIEQGFYDYGSFTIQNVSKDTSTLEFSLYDPPRLRTTPSP